MFNFGNDDKEELRENMEQIKEMVNRGETVGPGDREDDGFDQGGFEDPETPRDQEQVETQSFDGSQDEKPSPDTSDFSEPQQPQQSGAELEEELDEFEQKFGKQGEQPQNQPQQAAQGQPARAQQGSPAGQPEQDQQPLPQDETAPNSPPPNQHRSKATQGGVTDSRDLTQLSDEVPSAPETRDINVPEIDRGPLFLRQQKFLRAKQMIEDMIYLSDSMEQTVNDLEAGLQEDQEIERDVREILKEFEGDRSEVEDIISPREE